MVLKTQGIKDFLEKIKGKDVRKRMPIKNRDSKNM